MVFKWSRAAEGQGAGSDGLVKAIVVVQIAIAGALVCLMAVVAVEQAMGAALGAAACIAPTALFARVAVKQRGGRQLLVFGLAKSMAIVVLMVLCFVAARPEPLGFIVAVVTVHLAYVVTPLLSKGG